jgi:GNAT-like C-terminal domain/N-acyltransferase N-terminal domain
MLATLAARAGIDADTTTALLALLKRLTADSMLLATTRSVLEALLRGPSQGALAEIATLGLEQRLGEAVPLFYLLIALFEIPAGDARHAREGIDAGISGHTWRDLSIWCRHFRKLASFAGITRDTLEWAQHYLRGDLLRFGPVQFEPAGFTGPIVVLRHRRTHAIRVLAAPVAVQVDAATWEAALEAGTPMLEMHIPADAHLSVPAFVCAARDALALFARLKPQLKARGIFGEAWLLDPQLRLLLPRSAGIAALQRACCLYPSHIPEASTLERLFGPGATRESVVAGSRDEMNLLQRAVARFLSSPEHTLRAAGGFVLSDQLAGLPSS